MQTDGAARVAPFEKAWVAARAVPADDPARAMLLTNLAGELSFSLRTYAADAATSEHVAEQAWSALAAKLKEWAAIGVGAGSSAAGDELAVASAL
eukprot:7327818-Prymnesium_polylepis.1